MKQAIRGWINNQAGKKETALAFVQKYHEIYSSTKQRSINKKTKKIFTKSPIK